MPVLASFPGCMWRRKMHGLRSRIYNQLFVIPRVQRQPFWSSWTRRSIFQIRPCYFQFARWQLGSGWFGGEMSGTSSTSTYLLITRREWGMSGRDLSYKLASHPFKILCEANLNLYKLSCLVSLFAGFSFNLVSVNMHVKSLALAQPSRIHPKLTLILRCVYI